MKNKLLPVGGLGNRLRVIKTGLNVVGNEELLLYSIPTKFFPVHLDEVFTLPPNVTVERIHIPLLLNEKFITILGRLCHLFAKNNFSEYQGRSFEPGKILITPHALITVDRKPNVTTAQLLTIEAQSKMEYNAVHIRRGDNVEAVKNNDLAKFEEFIINSEKKVYVASDCVETKNYFLQKYPEKVFCKKLNLDRKSKQSFFDSITEIQCLVAADKFLPSIKSSFSSAILEFRCQ